MSCTTDRKVFYEEVVGHSSDPESRRLADELAIEYHYRCERYDRAVCTGSSDHDSSMPATNEEQAKIQRHARKVLEFVTRRAREEEVLRRWLRESIRKFAPLSFEAIEYLWERCNEQPSDSSEHSFTGVPHETHREHKLLIRL